MSKDNYNENVVIIRNAKEFSEHYNNVITERNAYESELADQCNHSPDRSHQIKGYCRVCKAPTVFSIDFLYSYNSLPNFRERLICTNCGMNSRQRYVVSRLNAEYQPGQRIYMYEQVTPAFNAVKQYCQEVIGSEFKGYDIESGTMVNGIRHENAEDLSFPDESFDLLSSNDVFEHVSDIDKALSEAHRVLKQGGKLMLSVPFNTSHDMTRIRTELHDGVLNYLLEPVYHGSAMSLVFYDFGWDLLDMIRKAGFSDVYLISYYDVECGHMGGIQFIIEAIK